MSAEKVFGALGDHNRFKMIVMLGQKPSTVDELRKGLNISQSSTSQHLKVLNNAGLVSFKKHGNFRVYSIKNDELKRAMSFFDYLWDESLAKLKMKLESDHE